MAGTETASRVRARAKKGRNRTEPGGCVCMRVTDRDNQAGVRKVSPPLSTPHRKRAAKPTHELGIRKSPRSYTIVRAGRAWV
jgi:hypothetical protein